jgi:hypothetical protein
MAAAFDSRCTTSSVSNRSAYMTKLLHDHAMAANTPANHTAPSSDRSAASSSLVRLTATTNTRSKNSSVHVAWRPLSLSSAVRSTGGRTAPVVPDSSSAAVESGCWTVIVGRRRWPEGPPCACDAPGSRRRETVGARDGRAV